MAGLFLPLSGDVTQSINPWTWFVRSDANQVGLFNVYVGQSADPTLERSILDDVGSYGRQIGRIGEALEVLIRHLETDRLSEHERVVLADFQAQMRRVAAAKRRKRGGGST